MNVDTEALKKLTTEERELLSQFERRVHATELQLRELKDSALPDSALPDSSSLSSQHTGEESSTLPAGGNNRSRHNRSPASRLSPVVFNRTNRIQDLAADKPEMLEQQATTLYL